MRAITEGSLRQIIRESLIAEQENYQKMGAAVDKTVTQAGSAVKTAVADTQKAAMSGIKSVKSGATTASNVATDALIPAGDRKDFIEKTAKVITDAIMGAGSAATKTSTPLAALGLLTKVPGARAFIYRAVWNVVSRQQQLFRTVQTPVRVEAAISELVASGQIEKTISDMRKQDKGYAEILGKIADDVVTRLAAMR